jgi:hypothetical protein
MGERFAGLVMALLGVQMAAGRVFAAHWQPKALADKPPLLPWM